MPRGEIARWRDRKPIRARALPAAWADWLGRIPWELFVVLTFDPKRGAFPVTNEVASKEAFWWCGQTARLLRRPVGWLYAVERGCGGHSHVHVLLVGISTGIDRGPSVIWQQRNGRIDVQPVHDGRGAVLYTTKDAAVEGEVIFSDTLGLYFDAGLSNPRIHLHPN